jgi:hypothetical protein
MKYLIDYINKKKSAPTGFSTAVLAVFAVLTILLFALPSLHASFYPVYDKYLFNMVIRPVQDFIFCSITFNFFWLIIVSILVHLAFRYWQCWQGGSSLRFVGLGIHLVLRRILLLFSLFYWLWGFHYLGFRANDFFGLRLMALKEERVKDEINRTLEHLLSLRYSMGYGDASLLPDSVLMSVPDDDLLQDCKGLFEDWRIEIKGDAAWKVFWPEGALLRIGTLGFYNPYTGECQLDKAVHPLQLSFIKAHEWTHAQGITDEGDANFLAYLICLHSDNSAVVYSGQLEYFRHLLRALRGINPEIYQLTLGLLPSGISEDIAAIRQRYDAFPTIMPNFRDAIYDTYLKVNSVPEGIQSYDRLVKMVFAWQRLRQT